MAGASIKIDIDIDDRAIQEALQRLADAGADLRPAFTEIGEHLDLATRQRFDRAQAPDGTPWEALSDATLRRKSRPDILVESTDLRNTLRYHATADSLEFGTDREYGATHQFGAKKGAFGSFSIIRTRQEVPIPWGDIPARPFLGVSGDDEAEIIDILQKHLARALG